MIISLIPDAELKDALAMAIRGFEPVMCFKVTAVTGAGVAEDPVREVTAWYTEHGELIRYTDPAHKEN